MILVNTILYERCVPFEGLPSRVGPNPGELGGGRSGGTQGYAGLGYRGVTLSGLG